MPDSDTLDTKYEEIGETCVEYEDAIGQARDYFAYWGKARPIADLGPRYHLLPFHALDVAACGAELIQLPRFSLASLADELGWPLEVVSKIFIFFLALHDLGKFARAFQNLVSNLSPYLVLSVPHKRYTQRHDTLGWLFWRDFLADTFPIDQLPDPQEDF